MKKTYDTIILGAGIAGLTAGKTLIENGHSDFIILESSYDIGGRVRFTEFGKTLLSTGPGWLHGRKNNPLYDITMDLKISTELVSKSNKTYYVMDCKNQKDITDEYVEKQKHLYEELKNIFETKHLTEDVTSSYSLMDVLKNNSEYFGNMTNLDKAVLFTSYELYCGAEWFDLSGWAEVVGIDKIHDEEEGEINFRITDPKGMLKLIDHLRKDINSNKVWLNNSVDLIKWNAEDNGDRVQISVFNKETNEKTVLMCRQVIVTVQSASLARGRPQIEPAVPESKLAAWNAVPSCDYCRLVARFAETFWPADREWLVCVTSDKDEYISSLANSTANQLMFWQNCYAQNLQGFDPTILVCHVSTGNRETRFRSLTEQQLSDEVTDTMSRMFPEAAARSLTRPIEVRLISHWFNEDKNDHDDYNARWQGAFSYLGVGFNNKTVKDIEAPVGPILFAGESTRPNLIGTVQAAYVSGKEAAIVAMNNKKQTLF